VKIHVVEEPKEEEETCPEKGKRKGTVFPSAAKETTASPTRIREGEREKHHTLYVANKNSRSYPARQGKAVQRRPEERGEAHSSTGPQEKKGGA